MVLVEKQERTIKEVLTEMQKEIGVIREDMSKLHNIILNAWPHYIALCDLIMEIRMYKLEDKDESEIQKSLYKNYMKIRTQYVKGIDKITNVGYLAADFEKSVKLLRNYYKGE